jgi:hypothetical protein
LSSASITVDKSDEEVSNVEGEEVPEWTGIGALVLQNINNIGGHVPCVVKQVDAYFSSIEL